MAFTLLQVWEDMSGSGQFNVILVNPSWTPRWRTRTSIFAVSALPDCVGLESLEEVSATLRIECFVVTRSSMVNEKMPFQNLARSFNVSFSMPIGCVFNRHTRWSGFVFCRINVFLCTGGALSNSVIHWVCLRPLFLRCVRESSFWSSLHSSSFQV